MTQWHPIFAQLLRPAVEAYYEVETTFPVGDAPREADFVLLRWTKVALPPPLATERAVAQLVVEQPELQQRYGGWMESLHPRAWQEIEAMVRKAGRGLKI